MKSLKLLFLGLMVMLFSCGDDDPLSETIVGTWNLESIEAYDCDDTDDEVPLTNVDSDGCVTIYGGTTCNIFLTFNSDGTATETYSGDSGTEVDDFTYTVNDDNNTVTLCEGNDCETFNVDEDKLTRLVIDDCTLRAIYNKN